MILLIPIVVAVHFRFFRGQINILRFTAQKICSCVCGDIGAVHYLHQSEACQPLNVAVELVNTCCTHACCKQFSEILDVWQQMLLHRAARKGHGYLQILHQHNYCMVQEGMSGNAGLVGSAGCVHCPASERNTFSWHLVILNRSQHCTPTVRKDNSLLGCRNRSTAGRARDYSPSIWHPSDHICITMSSFRPPS